MSEKKEEGAEGEAEAPKKKSKKMLFIILGVVVLLVGIGVPVFFMGGEKPKEGEEETEEPVEEAKIEVADLGTFVVNLSESSSFLKVKIQVEYDATILDKAEHEGGEGGGEGHGGGASGGEEKAGAGAPHPHMAKKDAQVRDAIIRVLSSKKVDEVLTIDGKEQLKEELVEALNEALGTAEPSIRAVYFTEFIVQ